MSADHDRRLIAELSDLARNGAPEERVLRKEEAQSRWETMRFYPLLVLGGLMAASSGIAALCFPRGVGSYIGVGICFLCLMAGVVWMNGKHREAYIGKKMADGMSRKDAERDYSNRYDGS